MSKPSFEALEEILGEVVDLRDVRLNRETDLTRDLAIDSSELYRILWRIEARFGSRFDPEELPGLRTLGHLLDAAAGLVKKRTPEIGLPATAGGNQGESSPVILRLLRLPFDILTLPAAAASPSTGFRLAGSL